MTGQLFLRDCGGRANNGKQLYLVVGVVGLDPVETLTLEGEHQYTIKNLELVDPIDRTEIARGQSPDGLVREPIWRV
jgi:hypothetical protein